MLKMRHHIRIPLNGQNKENATEVFEDVQLYFRTYSKSLYCYRNSNKTKEKLLKIDQASWTCVSEEENKYD